ncbi:aldose epimerase family protein [Deinococcus navajonensis]|uniref:Aldose 1-epimerase n=1 Tax=Deinococcus navajonensis TaxID=309884 RepID=A0ABV8XHM0_9DEIO
MTEQPLSGPAGSISAQPWGQAPDGQPITLFTLQTPDGTEARIMNYGGVLVSLRLPDRSGSLGDVVLGHDQPEPYFDRDQAPYFGALIGRYANRIAGGRFTLDGRSYALGRNNGPNALHGGEGGFDHRLWQANPSIGESGPALTLHYTSPDGEEGYPGQLDVTVRYELGLPGQLEISYEATCDAPTIVNLTNHTYWNLCAEASRDILDHELRVEADRVTFINENLIPVSQEPVEGTPFDFREWQRLGESLQQHRAHPQLQYPGGYDHNFVLRSGDGLRLAAQLREPQSGRRLDVLTTQPGLQVYTGNFLGGHRGKGGQAYEQHWGLCLETQHFPDSPNHPEYPSTVLRPGEVFRSRTCYAFSVEDGPDA